MEANYILRPREQCEGQLTCRRHGLGVHTIRGRTRGRRSGRRQRGRRRAPRDPLTGSLRRRSTARRASPALHRSAGNRTPPPRLSQQLGVVGDRKKKQTTHAQDEHTPVEPVDFQKRAREENLVRFHPSIHPEIKQTRDR
jgi:hypothetical protein